MRMKGEISSKKSPDEMLRLADILLAGFLQGGGSYHIEERSDRRSAASFEKGENRLGGEFTLSEARKLGILRKPSQTESEKALPRQLLWAAMVIDSVRALDPGLVSGIHSFRDEGTTPQISVTAQESKSAPKNESGNPHLVPSGKHKGKAWSELGEELLKAAMICYHPSFSEAHRVEIQKALCARKGIQNDNHNAKGKE